MSALVAGSIVVDLNAFDKGFSKGFGEAEKNVTKLEKTISDSQRKMKDKGDQLFTDLGDMAKNATLALGASFVGFGLGVLKATSDAQTLSIALKSSLGGSQEAADKAQNTIGKFAAKTPYDLQQVTESFIKLKNLGLDPSEDALTAYGNTASSMGKPLMQMIEAVADASTGEFERLKEFGIKSKKEGENVSFTFKDVTTTIKNDSKAIEGYLQNIGNTHFAGAMNEQSKSIAGTMSTLQDTISQKFVKIGQALKIDTNLPIVLQGLSDSLEKIDTQPLIDGLNSSVDGLTKVSTWIIDNKEIVISGLSGVAGVITAFVVPALWASAVAGWAAIAPMLPLVAATFLIVTGATLLALTIEKNWGVISLATQTTFTDVTKWIGGTWASISTGTSNFLNWIGTGISNTWNSVTTTTTSVWDGITAFFGRFWDNIVKGLSMAFLTIVALFTGNGELLKQIWEPTWTGILDFFNNKADGLKNGSNQMIDDLKASMLNFANSTKENWNNFWTSVANKATDTLNYIKEAMPRAFDQMVQNVANFGNSLKAGADTAMRQFGDRINETIEWIKNIDMKQVGTDMIQGLINGVKNMAGNLKNALGDAVNGAVQSAKDKLGIQSPSKVFYEIGGYTMEGMENGITENMSLPIRAINQATTSVISDPVNAIQTNQTQPTQDRIIQNNNFGNYLGTERDKRQLVRDLKDAINQVIPTTRNA